MPTKFYIDGEWVTLNELEDKSKRLDAVKAWFNSLPVYTVSHLCTVLVPFKDETVAQDRTLYTALRDILEVE